MNIFLRAPEEDTIMPIPPRETPWFLMQLYHHFPYFISTHSKTKGIYVIKVYTDWRPTVSTVSVATTYSSQCSTAEQIIFLKDGSMGLRALIFESDLCKEIKKDYAFA